MRGMGDDGEEEGRTREEVEVALVARRELGTLVRPLVVLVVRHGIVRHALALARLRGGLGVVQEELEHLGGERDRLELVRVCRDEVRGSVGATETIRGRETGVTHSLLPLSAS